MFGRSELSQLARMMINDQDHIRRIIQNEEATSKYMGEIFQKHLISLLNDLRNYDIKNPKHRAHIRDLLKNLIQDCTAFTKLDIYPNLKTHAVELLKILNDINIKLLSTSGLPDNSYFINYLEVKVSQIAPIFNAINLDLSTIRNHLGQIKNQIKWI